MMRRFIDWVENASPMAWTLSALGAAFVAAAIITALAFESVASASLLPHVTLAPCGHRAYPQEDGSLRAPHRIRL